MVKMLLKIANQCIPYQAAQFSHLHVLDVYTVHRLVVDVLFKIRHNMCHLLRFCNSKQKRPLMIIGDSGGLFRVALSLLDSMIASVAASVTAWRPYRHLVACGC